MSSPPATTPQERALRPSKFIEGSPLTGPDLQQQTHTSNLHFFNILSEMDEFERRRKHRNSHSSTESFISSGSPKDNRRSLGFGRPSQDASREALSGNAKGEEGKKSHKFVGRLRAITSGKEREREGQEKIVTYSGT